MNLTSLIVPPWAKWAAMGLAVAVPTAGWMITAHTLGSVREWQANVRSTTSTASHAGGLLALKAVAPQITAMGAALDKVEVVSAKAQAANVANNARLDAAQNKIKEETSSDIQKQIADARAAGIAYAERLRRSSPGAGDKGDAGQPSPGAAPYSTDGIAGAGGVPFMDQDDVRICGDNTVKALQWQRWNAKVSALPQNTPPE